MQISLQECLLLLSKFNRMPGSTLLGFDTKVLEDTTASICGVEVIASRQTLTKFRA